MHSRKRPAAEPILPIRDLKQPRLLKRYDVTTSSPPEVPGIFSRWTKLGQDLVVLVADTAISLVVDIKGVPATGNEDASSSMPELSSQNEQPSEEVELPTPRSSPLVYTPRPPPDSDLPSDGDTLTPPQDTRNVTSTNTRLPVVREDSSLSQEQPPSKQRTPASQSRSKQRPNTSPEQVLTPLFSSPSVEQGSKDDMLRRIETLHLDSSSNSMRSSQVSDSSTDFSKGSQFSQSSSKRSTIHPSWRNRRREHIYAQVHRARVRRDHTKLREEMARELFDLRRRQGYTSGFSDFKGLLEYQKRLSDIDSGHDSKLIPTFPFKMKRRPPRLDSDDEAFLQRAIEKAKATLNSPKPPKPFSPTFEQLLAYQRKRDEAIERRLRPPVPPLPAYLPPEDEEQVSQLLRKRGVISKFAREQVSDQDLARLQPGQWLNDEIINFYGAMILARSEECKENPGAKTKAKQPKKTPLNAHYFSSFFWTKLTQEGYDKGRLAKWTKKIDIFSKDIILLPVNHGNSHWTAATINFRQKRFESYDSMNMAKERVFKALRAYVNDEHNNKKKKPFDFTGWQDWAPESTPQQENGYDCGVFTCQFLEALSRGEETFNFSQKDMRYLRRRMIWEIGNAKLRDGH